MRRALASAIAGAIALLALTASEALARAGGGSAGFRGFGGGGGGIVVLIVVALLVFFVLPRVVMWWRAQQATGPAQRRKVSERARRVQTAAAEAAEDDPAFAPDVVKPAAGKLFLDIQRAWDAGDRIALRGLVAPDLLAEWERRLDDLERRGWHNRVQPQGLPRVEYVGLRNAAEDREDRVTVRIEATLTDYVEDRWGRHLRRQDSMSDTNQVREFWTLGKRDGHWILLSIEQGAEGAHALDEEIVATPWGDERAMRDESLVEGAIEDAAPEGTNIAELADLEFQGNARAAALDLSLADARFAPDILEVAARRAAQAWAEAVDGEDQSLLAIARPDAAQQLLHPGDPTGQTRLVVRGPQVKQIRVAALDAAANPPTMTIEVDIHGRRYMEDRDTTAIVAGSQSHAVTFTERWTLALEGDDREPWRISQVASPLTQR